MTKNVFGRALSLVAGLLLSASAIAAGGGNLEQSGTDLDDRASLRALGLTGVVFGVLQAIALARHGDQLDWAGAPAVGYVLVLATLTAVSAWLLGRPRRT